MYTSFTIGGMRRCRGSLKCSNCLVIDSSITDECLSGVLPPYPICCLAQNATALVKKAQESSTRCCSPPAAADLELCSEYDCLCKCMLSHEQIFVENSLIYFVHSYPLECPVKDSEKFKSRIGDHCRAVAACPTLDSLTVVSMTNNNLRGIDMEKQIQREEYTHP